MTKVTSKLQVTLPRAIADRYGIRPGDEVEWVAAEDSLRLLPLGRSAPLDLESRLRLFDEATYRQRAREAEQPLDRSADGDRGWVREDLYTRGRTD